MSLRPETLRAAAARGFAALGRMPLRRVDFALSCALTLLAMILYAYVFVAGSQRAVFGFLANVEQRSVDARFMLRGARAADPRIVVVDIDERTIQQAGAYPIPRDQYALLLDRLRADGAVIVSFDVNFPTPEKNSAHQALSALLQASGGGEALSARVREVEQACDNDARFARAIALSGNVILGEQFESGAAARSFVGRRAGEDFQQRYGSPWPQALKVEGARDFDLNAAWAREGRGAVAQAISSNIDALAAPALSQAFFDFDPDADGTVRRSMLMIRLDYDGDFYPSLALETMRRYERVKDQSLAAYMSENGMERIEAGARSLTVARDASILINFVGPYRSYPHYSLASVVAGETTPGLFGGKIVLVGATAKAAGDLRSTPFQKADQGYMGVELHANVIDNLLHSEERGRGPLRRGFDEEMIDLALLLAFGLGLGWLFSRVRPVWSLATAVAVLAGFASAAALAFGAWGMCLNMVTPMLLIAVDYASITSLRVVFEEREKRRVRRTFERYVSPGVIRLIEQNPQKYFRPGGETRELTVMFSDIRSFTSLSEGMTADQLVQLLNEYLGEMTDILFERWGTLDKYIGDAIMAFWGSPFPQDDHARRACECMLDMTARLEEMNLNWAAQGRPPLAIGIGVATGPVSVGNMGSSRRFSWTVMGDTVNLASRLEGLNKEYRTTRIVSESTFLQARERFCFRELDEIRVKGKLQPVRIYELLGRSSDEPRLAARMDAYAAARQAYREQRWEEAIFAFEKLLALAPQDGAAEVMLRRAMAYAVAPPPPDWDGVHVMKTK